MAPCEACQPEFQRLQDELVGALSTLRSQNARIGKLTREEKDVKQHDQWNRCERLFRVWRRATGHTRSRLTPARFRAALPFLEIHEDEMICRGIEGIAYDPWIRPNKNGLRERVDGWGDLFKDDETFERFVNKAPIKWRDSLIEHAAEIEGLTW